MSGTENTSIVVSIADSDEAYNHVFNIRTTVFVEEKFVDDEDEYDGFDHLATHYLAQFNGKAVGTARWRVQPNSGNIRLERFAVLKAFRRKGIGSALMERILNDIGSNKNIYVHVQPDFQAFFAAFSFRQEGDEFEEAGLIHLKMLLSPPQAD